ncbi:hypothetical protein [Leifsonia sp. AG29]|uniref:hypothetical protein n=1 Tax=Leifsonia sp. AG29 TaxID=2598860 RepID=UPI00131AE2B7|nr:hypothetical protein [Leifsonia sp. AG29]
MSPGRRLARFTGAALIATLLAGCTSVPVLSDPMPPKSPGGPQKTITELRQQVISLLQDSIDATGNGEGWLWIAYDPQVPWSHDLGYTGLASCSTVGEKGSHQIRAHVYRAPLGEPHDTARVLGEHWESQGFTLRTVFDQVKGDHVQILLVAERADGISQNVYATEDTMSIEVLSECSTHESFDYFIEHGDDPPPSAKP